MKEIHSDMKCIPYVQYILQTMMQAKLAVQQDIMKTDKLPSYMEEHRLIILKMKILLTQIPDVLHMKQDKRRMQIRIWERNLIINQRESLHSLKLKLSSFTHQELVMQIYNLMKYEYNIQSWNENIGGCESYWWNKHQDKNKLWKIEMSWFCLNVVEARLENEVYETIDELYCTYNNIIKKYPRSDFTEVISIIKRPSNLTEVDFNIGVSISLMYLQNILQPFIKYQFGRLKTLPKKGDLATANIWFHPFRSTIFDLDPVIRMVNSFLGGNKNIGRI